MLEFRNFYGVMDAETISKKRGEFKSQMSKRNVMQRTFLFFGIFCIFCVANTIAQDVITLKNGMVIQALVQEIGEEDVKVKKYDNPDGTDYTLKKWGISTIMRADGRKEDYSSINPPPLPAIGTSMFLKKKEEAVKKALFEDFENRMNICGFTKRIIVYDFSDDLKNLVNNYHPLWTIGIWLNHQKQFIALRPDKDNYNGIIIPIDEIQNIRVLEDGIIKTVPGFFDDKIKEKVNVIQLRIATGKVNTGIETYFLKLYNSENSIGGVSLNKASNLYKSIEECIRTINDEIEFMSRNSR